MDQRPYTTRTQKALALANAAAENLGDPFIGTEHVLLGLLDEKTGPAAQMLVYLGITRAQVDDLLAQIRSGRPF